jgi:hypothetical protein
MATGPAPEVRRAPRRIPMGLAITLAFLALASAGCALTPSHTPRASAQWSNGRLVGMGSLNNPVALQVDERGNSFMVWVGLEHELQFAHLDERAEVMARRRLDLHSDSPLTPQMLLDSAGQLHLAWLDKRDRSLQLVYARLSTDGEVIQGPTVLSEPEQRAAHVAMALNAPGRTMEIFWSDNVSTRPGCYHTALDWSGTVVVPAHLLIPDGILPAAQCDQEGFVHLAWREDPQQRNPEFHYAVYDPQRQALGADLLAGEPVAQAALIGRPTAGVTFEGPWLGLDESSVYLAWVLEVREAGDAMDFTFYQAFSRPALGERQAGAAFDYPLPSVGGQAVHLQGVDPRLTGHPRFLAGDPARQVLAFFTQVSGPGNLETLQIGVSDLQAGQVKGQEIINASRGASLQPSVATDGQTNLHASWIDTAGFRRYQVVYASTSAQAKSTLNRITAYEVADTVFSAVMRVFSAALFVPLVLSWVFIPIGWLVVFVLTTHQFEISDPRGPLAVGAAMLLHLGAKLLFSPGLLNAVPFGSLFSPSAGLFLGRWVLPMVLAMASAGLLWLDQRRRQSRSVFTAYFIYAAVDSLLTLLIYVVPVMG